MEFTIWGRMPDGSAWVPITIRRRSPSRASGDGVGQAKSIGQALSPDKNTFAAAPVVRMGREVYPDARQLLITAEGGGSNGSRVRLWKLELQKLSDETALEISVCHFPPGTSKWNKIEHRLFSFITKHWRGKPLVSHEVIVNLIAATTTRTGLRVQSLLDTGTYPKGIKVGKQEFAALKLSPDSFHGEWNYTITPR